MDDLDRILADYDPLEAWPNCSTADCSNKVCTWASPNLCHPCASAVVGQEEMERRYQATHDSDGYLL